MLAEYIKNKGVTEGIQQGIQQGMKNVLIRMISKKYQQPKEAFIDLLEHLTEEELEELEEKILFSDTWKTIINWLEKPA